MIKRKFILIIALLLIFLILLYIFVNGIAIYKFGEVDQKRKSDVIVVLGAETDINGVSPVYRERINHGIWLYENGYADYIIVTGGKAEGAEYSDAYYAKKYMLSEGVPEKAVITEDKSVITQQNIEYSGAIMKENKWSTCIIVSDPLHMKRSMVIAEDYGMKAVSSPTPTSRYKSLKTKIPFLLREEFFYTGYKLYKLFSF